jgi:hypothetical protein
MGLFAVVAFAAFLRGVGCRVTHVVAAVLVLVAQPLFVYHLHVPTSEMFHLFLLCGMGLLLPLYGQRPAGLLLLGLLLVSGILNRLSFLPFSGLVLLGVAWMDLARADRRRVVWGHGFLVAATAVALLFDLRVAAITVVRLKKHVPALVGVWAAGVVGVAALDLLATQPRLRQWMHARAHWVIRGGALLGLALLVAFLLGGIVPKLQDGAGSLASLLPFLGEVSVACAGLGACLLCWRAREVSSGLAAMLFVFSFVALGLLVKAEIAPLYPWATRRHVPYALPAIAALVGYLVSWVSVQGKGPRRWAGRVSALLLLGIVMIGVDARGRVAQAARRAKHAWAHTEYNGLVSALEAVAAEIRTEDIVVADHPWWATPLTFVFDKRVLNARQFYARKDKGATMQKGLSALERLQREGHRVRWLTSTADGLTVYPLPVPAGDADWESGEVVLQERVQGKRVDGFHLKARHFVFRLYTLTSASEEPGKDTGNL